VQKVILSLAALAALSFATPYAVPANAEETVIVHHHHQHHWSRHHDHTVVIKHEHDHHE
jgi:hypothetical protein